MTTIFNITPQIGSDPEVMQITKGEIDGIEDFILSKATPFSASIRRSGHRKIDKNFVVLQKKFRILAWTNHRYNRTIMPVVRDNFDKWVLDYQIQYEYSSIAETTETITVLNFIGYLDAFQYDAMMFKIS
jgi:hypothetical protein